MSTASEITKKIRRIELTTRKTVTEALAGDYKSAFRGSGMEFDEVREYQPGDDVRSIDWNVTARQGRPFIKRFHEERELTVFLAVDLSASGRYGAGTSSKNDLAAEICATLAFSAIKSNDKVGLLLFTDCIELFIPPAKGLTHAMRLIREVLGFQPRGRGTDIASAMDFLGKALHKRAVVFLVSDFIGDKNCDQALRRTAHRHDLVALSLSDPSEAQLPDAGVVEIEDAETGERMLVDTSSAAVRDAYALHAAQREDALRQRLQRNGIDALHLNVGEDFAKPLTAFMRRRK